MSVTKWLPTYDHLSTKCSQCNTRSNYIISLNPEMNKIIKMISLILLLTLNFSCVDNKSTERKTNNPELVTTLKADTLKFTSGISSIFQDNKEAFRKELLFIMAKHSFISAVMTGWLTTKSIQFKKTKMALFGLILKREWAAMMGQG